MRHATKNPNIVKYPLIIDKGQTKNKYIKFINEIIYLKCIKCITIKDNKIAFKHEHHKSILLKH